MKCPFLLHSLSVQRLQDTNDDTKEEDDDTALRIPHLRICRVNEETSKSLEQYVRSELAPCRFSTGSSTPASLCLPCTPSRRESGASESTSHTLLQLSATDMTDDECQMDNGTYLSSETDSAALSDTPHWRWIESSISASYSIVKCGSEEQRQKVKAMLLRKQVEDAKVATKHNETMGKQSYLSWYVTDCCCTDDIPHRIEDKFILLRDGDSQWMDQKTSIRRLTLSKTEPTSPSSKRTKKHFGITVTAPQEPLTQDPQEDEPESLQVMQDTDFEIEFTSLRITSGWNHHPQNESNQFTMNLFNIEEYE